VRTRHGDIETVVRQRTVVARGLAEHGRQQRQVGVHIRHHHDDVGRLDRRVVAAQREQGVAQDFEFAQSGVAGMHA